MLSFGQNEKTHEIIRSFALASKPCPHHPYMNPCQDDFKGAEESRYQSCLQVACQTYSGGTSNRKLELSVAGAYDLSARVQKLIAWKLRAHDILIAITHAPDACVA